MGKANTSSLVLKSLAGERRAIVADWRIHVAHCRSARSAGLAIPDAAKTTQLIHKLCRAGDLEPIAEIPGVYRIAIPYASVLPAPSEIILQEANPVAVFSHFTAAQYHNLTYELPSAYHLTHYHACATRIPLGTTPEDWTDAPQPRQRTPGALSGVAIHWHKSKPEWDFGHMLGHVQGCPLYITDVERTVIDALRFPERCGGAAEVLGIWKRAASVMDVTTVVHYAQKFAQTLLRQRVGFLLESLGLSHPTLNRWAEKSVRGSSARLFANLEFAADYSARWNLSLNHSVAHLAAGTDD